MSRVFSTRALVGVSIAGLLVCQRLVEAHATGRARVVLGYAVSLAFCAAIAELGMPIRGARQLKARAPNTRAIYASLYVLLTILLILSALSAQTAPFFVLRPLPPPIAPLVVLIGCWIAMLCWIGRHGSSSTRLAVSLVGLVTATRLLVLWGWPFHRIDGDMLITIDRALDELTSGRFPYINYPPPMPYPPETFLAYLIPKRLGLDLRYANLVSDAVTVLAAVNLGRLAALRHQTGNVAGAVSAPLLNQVLLPCFMLHPVWIHYSVNSHFSPCTLLAALLGFAVLQGNLTIQAVALGLALGSNQMFAACGPILLAYWAGRGGPRRAAGLAAVAGSVLLIIIAPFLLWDPRRFIEIAFLSRSRFSDSLMAGRFTLLPIASRLIPHASLVGTTTALAAASLVAFRSRNPATVVSAMASGLCAALLFQPVSFAHYYLPCIVLASLVPTSTLADRTEPLSPGLALPKSRMARSRPAGQPSTTWAR